MHEVKRKYLMRLMQQKGKVAVWGALESNQASSRLAQYLGFSETDELWALTRKTTQQSVSGRSGLRPTPDAACGCAGYEPRQTSEEATMIETHGLSHLNLEVADPDASLRFYETLFGVRECFRDEQSVQVLGPGEHDVLAFIKSSRAGKEGGISHFGFRLKSPDQIEDAMAQASAFGARILRSGEFAPGEPYVYIEDPDGYEIEIWYE